MQRVWVIHFMLVICGILHAEIDPVAFQRDFELYRRNPHYQARAQLVEQHRNTIFVFVTGLTGEETNSTWQQTIDELDHYFGDSNEKKNFLIQPDSRNTVIENAIWLKIQLDEILNEVGRNKKIVLVGHSKGAYEAWTMLMPEPDFVKKHIAGAIFLQGPFLGAQLANAIISGKSVGEISPFLSDPMAWGTRWLLSTKLRSPEIRRGLESIMTHRAKAHTADIQRKFGPDFDEEAHSRTLFIKTSIHPDDISNAPLISLDRAMLTCEQTLQKLSRGPNDGAVKTDHQYPLYADERTITLRRTHHQTIVKTDVGAAFAKALLSITP